MAELHPLKKYRAERGITQAELAGELRVWPLTVSRWERGERTPRPKDAMRIAVHTGISVGELIEAGGGVLPHRDSCSIGEPS